MCIPVMNGICIVILIYAFPLAPLLSSFPFLQMCLILIPDFGGHCIGKTGVSNTIFIKPNASNYWVFLLRFHFGLLTSMKARYQGLVIAASILERVVWNTIYSQERKQLALGKVKWPDNYSLIVLDPNRFYLTIIN